MIGIFGGTFDPVHFGHLRTALDVAQSLKLEQVRFIPCNNPPHREPPVASPAQRLAMLKLAIAGQAGFQLDDREIRRAGPSFMVDTLLSLRQELGDEVPLGLILGMDAFSALDSWHEWQRLIELAHLLVMTRPGWHEDVIASHNLQKLIDNHKSDDTADCHKKPAGCVVFLPVSQLGISSTNIRQTIMAGNSIRYLLPDSVYTYIKTEQIY